MPRKGRDAMQFPEEKLYTIEDIYALPDDKRGELIDGKLYMMAPPSRTIRKSFRNSAGSSETISPAKAVPVKSIPHHLLCF